MCIFTIASIIGQSWSFNFHLSNIHFFGNCDTQSFVAEDFFPKHLEPMLLYTYPRNAIITDWISSLKVIMKTRS